MRTVAMTRQAANQLAAQTLKCGYTKIDAYSGRTLCPLLTCRAEVVGHAHPGEPTSDLGMHRALSDHIHNCPKQF